MVSLDFSVLFRKIFFPLLSKVGNIAGYVGIAFLALSVYALMKYRLNPFKLSLIRLIRAKIKIKLLNCIRWVIVDLIKSQRRTAKFREYGLTMYCGRQGSGKTISMVHYLNWIHNTFPECIIVTNFGYRYANHIMTSWRDFFEIRNGTKGVVFALDEIHSEYSSAAWKDFPEDLLSEISQQRKQRVKIVASSQVFGRVVKPLREQCFSVMICTTFLNRWTFNREYDANDYEVVSNNPAAREKLGTLRRNSFVQSDFLRRCYNTYEKIQRLQKADFIPRGERGPER